MHIIPKPLKAEISDDLSAYKNYSYSIDERLQREEYILTVNQGEANAICGSERAEFYVRQTMAQLVSDDQKIPDCTVRDRPRFAHRGLMIDSARHYQSIEEIKKMIDAMALLKLNTFHWHLCDDQGWRIESEAYPQLKAAAVRPCSRFGKKHDDAPYGIFYTKAEMKEIVDYCAARFIDVIPEFDMPGHTSAFLSAFPEAGCTGEAVEVKTHQGIYEDVICPAKEEVYPILETLLDELCEVFPYGIYHIGGDEVKHQHWEACSDCQKKMQELGITSYNDYENYFLNRIIDYLATKGKQCIVWNDALRGKGIRKENTIVQYWWEKEKDPTAFANEGGRLILSPFSYYYLDYDYDITSLRRVLSYDPMLKGLNEEGRKNIFGIEAPIWTEFVNNNRRMEALAFPRLLAVACTAWQYERFSYREFLQEAAPMMEEMKGKGFHFRSKKLWGLRPSVTPLGWLRFVKTYYSLNYILGKEKE